MTRKSDEIRLYNLLRQRPGEHEKPLGLADDYFEAAQIHPGRGYYVLEKWADKGWWDYGVSLRGGWFTPQAPDKLT